LQPAPPLDKSFYVDLLIFNPSDDGIADNAPLRAVVEFKVSPEDISGDVLKTKRLVTMVKAKYPLVFGYVVAGGQMFAQPDIASAQMEAVKPFVEKGHGPILSRAFNDPLPGYGQYYGAVIGLPVTL
jgi:hypothetical protein